MRKLPYIITLLQLTVTLFFLVVLYWTKLIPEKYLLIIGILLFALSFIVYLLTKRPKCKIRFCFGTALMVFLTVVYLVGAGYILEGVNTISNITQTTVETSDIGLYVCQDSSIKDISDLKESEFGIPESPDRENTDLAVLEIEKVLGKIQIKEYPGIIELADGILAEEVDAIVLNSAFLEILAEIAGYEEIEEQLREIHKEQVEVVIEQVHETEQPDMSNVFSVYISGIDSRKGLVAKSRSDVNIVATINPDTRQVLLISTPRDYYVPLSISDGMSDKLTHAGIYGIDVSMETLEMLYDTEIDYYFRLNFSGFEEIIDALGGITVESDYAFTTSKGSGYSYVKGENRLNGAEALDFVRERKAFAEGDRQRGKNQLAVIEAVIKKAMSPSLLKNYTEFLRSVEGSFETSIPYDVIAELVRSQLDEGDTWNIVSYSVDGSGAHKRPYSMNTSAYVMIPDETTVETAIEMMVQIKSGEILEVQ